MLSSIWVISALLATTMAAPTQTYSSQSAEPLTETEALSSYFEALVSKVQAAKGSGQGPSCDLGSAVLPVASPTALPPPSAGLTLKHVAIGRGTQNYTCGTDGTAAPTAVGAMATLYNASCVAAAYPDVLAMLPRVALQFNLTGTNQATLSPSNLQISGHHFFANLTTPFFNLDTATMNLGTAPSAKNNTVPAPADAPVGQYGVGFGAVPWLKLLTIDGATGNLEEIYRVNTAGGSPPKTCAGMPSAFEVQYSAEYWFFQGS
ncbi:hypothetical protein OIDMADRAFT_18602 [Oidiodendron maius Zn]|uniref:Malate dehydrogenase n=1 Tax=Oidiodendron maius (strain Zn) TaxID=913774 RepID=A0A0C3HEU2_OIDMZ|nr:hypothetical protein OIDMADRAFT_18602 [Oidiodendron maius Zn]